MDSNFRAFWLTLVTWNILECSLFRERREKCRVVLRKFQKKLWLLMKQHFFIHQICWILKQLSPSGSVKSGGYIAWPFVSRYISSTIHLPFGILLLDTIRTILGPGKYSVSWKQQKNVPFTDFSMFPLLIFSEPTNWTCVTMSQQIAMLFSHPLTKVQTLYLGLYMQILFYWNCTSVSLIALCCALMLPLPGTSCGKVIRESPGSSPSLSDP